MDIRVESSSNTSLSIKISTDESSLDLIKDKIKDDLKLRLSGDVITAEV